jgi:hypothetical protein
MFSPRLWLDRPMIKPVWIVGRFKPIGVNRRLERFGFGIPHRRKGDAAALSHAACLGGVREDAIQPRLEGRASLETIDAFEHAQPGVLHHLFGGGAIGYIHLCETQQRGVVLLDQGHKGAFVAATQGLDQLSLVRVKGMGGHDQFQTWLGAGQEQRTQRIPQGQGLVNRFATRLVTGLDRVECI